MQWNEVDAVGRMDGRRRDDRSFGKLRGAADGSSRMNAKVEE
jgi:hypothetical protein